MPAFFPEPGPPGPAGPPGAPGAPGARASILYGVGAPTAADGVDGDSYVDRDARRLYGPKAAGAWPTDFIPLADGALPEPPLVADYYVDSVNGSDANDGATPETAWQTIGKLSSVASWAGTETIGLARGSRWKETLTVPASGVTIAAYGDAPVYDADGYCTNAPVIDGGEYVTGWSAYSGGATSNYAEDNFTGTAGAELAAGSTMEQGGPWVKHTATGAVTAILTAAGTVRRGGAGTCAYTATGAPPSPDYAVEADFIVKTLDTTDPTRICLRMDPFAQTFYSFMIDPGGFARLSKFVASVGTHLPNGSEPFTWEAGTTYRLRLEAEGTTLRGYVDGVLVCEDTDTSVFTANRGGFRMGGSSAPAPSDTAGIHLDNFAVTPLIVGTPVNTYQATLAAEAKLVELRGAYSPNGASPDSLADGAFFWQGGKLYVRSDDGKPSDTAVIAGSRSNCVNGGTRSDVTLKGIGCEHANDRTIVFTGGTGARVEECMVQRSSGGTGSNGTLAFTGHSAWTVDSCVIRDCGSDGIYAATSTGMVVTGNRIGPVYGPNADCLQVDSGDGVTIGSTITGNTFTMTGSASPKGCVILFGSTHLVEDNYMEGGNNFGVSCPGSHFIVRRNVFVHTGPGGAVRIMDNPPGVALDDHLVTDNVMVDCPVAILVGSGGSGKNRTAQRYVANTIVNVTVQPDAARAQVWADQPIAGEFRDNVLWNTSGGGRSLSIASVVAGQTWTSDYNIVGPEATDFVSYAGTLYATLSAYSAGKSQDAHSLAADPRFVDPAGKTRAALQPKVGSPAIGQGVLISGLVTSPTIGAKP